MKLEGRNLSFQMHGGDVESLKKDLRKLGHSVDDGEADFGRSTHQAVLEFQRKRGLAATGVVDGAIVTLINAEVDALGPVPGRDEGPARFIVRGQVRQADGSPAIGSFVQVFDKDLRSQQELGAKTKTDGEGRFEVTYAAKDFSRAEKESADLTFQLENQDGVQLEKFRLFRLQSGKKDPVEALQIIFNARIDESVEIAIGDERSRGLSEYERYIAEITPLLQGIPFAELTEDERHQDITFLKSETGINPQHIAYLIVAHKLTAQINLLNLPPEVFYGFFRRGLPTRLTALLLQSQRVLRRAFLAALDLNITPARLRKDVDTILEVLMGLLGKYVLQSTDEQDRFPLRDLLKMSSLSQAEQEKFLKLSIENEKRIEDFWKALRENPDFKRDDLVDNLQFTLRLGVLTHNNIPLAKALKGLDTGGAPPSLRNFAKLDVDAWKKLIHSAPGAADAIPETVSGETKEEKVTNYANGIIENLRAAVPTTFVSLGIAKVPAIDLGLARQVTARNPDLDLREPLPGNLDWADLGTAEQEKAKASIDALRQEIKMFPAFDYQSVLAPQGGDGAPGFENPIRKGMTQFFKNEPDFEFRDTHIETYLSKHVATAFTGVPEKDRPAVTQQLKSMQRVFNIAPRYDHMQALMGEGIHSAFSIASIPQRNFVQLFSSRLDGPAQAMAYYSAAGHKTAMMMNGAVGIHESFHGITPSSVGNFKKTKDALTKKMPTLAELFGSFDLCKCEHCRSVYGPAAYFVDLLQFLRKSGGTPFKVLDKKRPDLQHLELSCENTNTQLPYIDLVNEILEFYVAFGGLQTFSLVGKVTPVRNTNNISAEELSVNPQFTIEGAYTKLLEAVHTFHLPFNRPVEVARAYLEHLGSSRYQVMKVFQKTSNPNLKNPSDLSLALEFLKITSQEYNILLGKVVAGHIVVGKSSKVLREFFGYSDDEVAYTDSNDKPILESWTENLSRVPEFLRRTGIRYLDLVDLTKARFINPGQGALEFMEENHLKYAVIAEFAKANFTNPNTQLLGALKQIGMSVAQFTKWAKTNFANLQKLIVLYAPDSKCDLSITTIQHLDGTDLTDVEWLKMHRFLRLWKKPGWTMQELDKAMEAFEASDIDNGFLQNLAHLKWLQAELNVPVVKLLSLWAPIDTLGDDSLYLKLFQNKAVLNPVDTDFELNDEATELEKAAAASQATITDNVPAILAALRINADDLEAIRTATGLGDHPEANPPALAVLNLSNLSNLYRHALLAKALKVKVKEFIALKSLTGLDPFQPSAAAPTVEFVGKAGNVRKSGFTVAQLNYIYRHVSEPTKSIAPSRDQVVLLAKQLHDGLVGISDDNVLAPDPAGELTGKKLGMIWESAVVEQMISMLNGSAVYSVSLASTPAIPFPDELKSKISYDMAAKALRFTGPMTLKDRKTLLNVPADAEYGDAINNLFQQPRTFLSNTKAGFLTDPADAEAQLLDIASLKTEQKFQYLLTGLLPYLRKTLSRSLVKQTMSDALKLDGAIAELLLERLLKSPANTNQPVMEDFLSLLENGLTAEYFTDPQLTVAAPTPMRIDPTIAFDGEGVTPGTTIPANTGSVRWTGMLLAANNGDFTFYINANGSGQLWAGDNSKPFTLQLDPETKELSSPPITLKAGQLVELRLELTKLGSPAVAELRWSSPVIPKDIIPESNLFPSSIYEAFAGSFILLHKVAPLVNIFNLTDRELDYFSAHGGEFAGVDPVNKADVVPFNLNTLPLESSGFKPALFNQWERLLDFVTLRNSLTKGEVGLLEVFASTLASESRDRLSALTGWDVTELDHAIGSDGFNLAANYSSNEGAIVRLKAAFDLGRRLGLSVKKLFNWATQQPNVEQGQDIVKTVKAKHDDEQWLVSAKPLNDKLRESQRTALVAYILADKDIVEEKITDSNQLFEYFLIDVNMGACFVTSRVKQAISSVQLFIHRCLMNLEPEVSPLLIDADWWKWMKNYRVWEANRKVFLYPENWTEPELRHKEDKSPFFKDLETQLLQNDVTDETVEQALLNYLQKLDEVARLEICGMYRQQEKEGNEKTDIVHVFGRTFNPPYIYYYRRLEVFRSVWTPWEKVNLDIAVDPISGGVHLMPVIYNRRLYLFWPIFEEKPNEAQDLSAGQKSQAEAAYEQKKKVHDDWEKEHQCWQEKLTLWQQAEQAYYDVWTDEEAVAAFPVESPKQPKEPEKPGEAPAPNEVKPTASHWEIKLAWSDHKNGTWSPKKVSEARISTEALGEFSDHLNQTDFLFKTQSAADDALQIIPKWKANWSTFLSWEFEAFELVDCNGAVRTKGFPHWEKVLAPANTRVESMTFVENAGAEQPFYLSSGKVNESGDLVVGSDSMEVILEKTPTTFTVAYPHQFPVFISQFPFFYQDYQRTYFVIPKWDSPIELFTKPGKVKPGFEIDFDGGSASGLESFMQMNDLSPQLQSSLSAAGGTMVATEQPSVSVVVDSSNGGIDFESSVANAWNGISQQTLKQVQYLKFATFFHPHVCTWIKTLNRKGMPGLLTLGNQRLNNDQSNTLESVELQLLLKEQPTVFERVYDPLSLVVHPDYPKEDVDFSYEGAYSLYNWELFFHTPLLIAHGLSKNQRFEEAMKWFHYIFDPTYTSTSDKSPQRFWKVLPFYENSQPEKEQIQNLLTLLSTKDEDLDEEQQNEKEKIGKQVAAWRDNPFDPHLIARLRITAYQKNVVMKYLDNLIAWGDQLFSRDTIESINEATQLYIMAYNILGSRPKQIPERGKIEVKTYSQLQPHLDSFSNGLVELENEFPFSSNDFSSSGANSVANSGLGTADALYFCIPQNEKLSKYWDTVEDRLFKIRHCMNIEGVVRQLPLFEPPIDPALLVKAFAMGVDISSVLNDINTALPHYRFTYMLQKAVELCSEVKSLGGALLSALEKKDAEELSILRVSHETNMLKAVREVKAQQIQEAHLTLDGLRKSRAVVEARRDYYKDVEFMNEWETAHLVLTGVSAVFQAVGGISELAAAGAHAVPDAFAGGAGSFGSPLTFAQVAGGSKTAASLQSVSRLMSMLASLTGTAASVSATMGSNWRRWDDWKQQEKLANRELEQIDKQIAAGEIRTAIAERELENHERQIENSVAVEEFMRNKYTNPELYGWMLSQISAVFFQSYKLAYDVAKRAEKAYRFERGLTSSNFIQFGYWDSLRKGLLSGERLSLDLKRMEMAYLDQNKREYEITRSISLVLHDPMALITLKETGLCELELPEAFFDMDYPGHYMRRIKSVSLTIPCVAGPYTSINCTLTLLSNKTRIDSNAQSDYLEQEEDTRFVTNFTALQSIVTSHAQNDSGMFELNFRDERYLPFEGAGLVSRWRVALPKECNVFDFDTISDVIFRINYTAREGGDLLRKKAADAAVLPPAAQQKPAGEVFVPPAQENLVRMISAKHEFPSDWHRFLHPAIATVEPLKLDLSKERFPFRFRSRPININAATLLLKVKEGVAYDDANPLTFNLTEAENGAQSLAGLEFLTDGSPFPNLPAVTLSQWPDPGLGTWLIQPMQSALLSPNAIEDMWIVVDYSVV